MKSLVRKIEQYGKGKIHITWLKEGEEVKISG